jgi:hypothetical protein
MLAVGSEGLPSGSYCTPDSTACGGFVPTDVVVVHVFVTVQPVLLLLQTLVDVYVLMVLATAADDTDKIAAATTSPRSCALRVRREHDCGVSWGRSTP